MNDAKSLRELAVRARQQIEDAKSQEAVEQAEKCYAECMKQAQKGRMAIIDYKGHLTPGAVTILKHRGFQVKDMGGGDVELWNISW